jgi:hypothetical protein
MFDLMLPRGMNLKTYLRQEEDRREVVQNMKQ